MILKNNNPKWQFGYNYCIIVTLLLISVSASQSSQQQWGKSITSPSFLKHNIGLGGRQKSQLASKNFNNDNHYATHQQYDVKQRIQEAMDSVNIATNTRPSILLEDSKPRRQRRHVSTLQSPQVSRKSRGKKLQGYDISNNNNVDYCTTSFVAAKTVQPVDSKTKSKISNVSSKKGVTTPATPVTMTVRPLVFWENMICGAISRTVAQTIMHPANTMKTILQSSSGVGAPTFASLFTPRNFRMLTRGAGANFVLSVPHGAVNFAVLEFVRARLKQAVQSFPILSERAGNIGPALDFMSSAISTICCSVVSTPQMMITDNIMVGNYPNLPKAVRGLYQSRGIMGFYAGWFPGLVGKIPSYALTWTLFQQLKELRNRFSDRPALDIENTIMGCIASGTSVCVMIPIDTIKTRLVTQISSPAGTRVLYKGIIDCAVRVLREEGIGAFYKGLAPRLMSVVPMIGIQFSVYEFMRRVMTARVVSAKVAENLNEQKEADILGEAVMEVAADAENPCPAPQFINTAIEVETKEVKKKSLIWKKKK